MTNYMKREIVGEETIKYFTNEGKREMDFYVIKFTESDENKIHEFKLKQDSNGRSIKKDDFGGETTRYPFQEFWWESENGLNNGWFYIYQNQIFSGLAKSHGEFDYYTDDMNKGPLARGSMGQMKRMQLLQQI